MTARIAPADVAAVVARLTEIGAHDEAATVTALATDLDASRLLGPHRDWWADIAASVGRSCITLPDVAVAVREAVARKDAEIARLRAGASMVGALLATAPAGSTVEWIDAHARWRQCQIGSERGDPVWCDRAWVGSRWRGWCAWMGVDIDAFLEPGRLVRASEADADPNTRGPIGGAP